MSTESSLIAQTNLVKLQEQAYDRFIQGQYSEAESLYIQLIVLDSTSKNNYWYLGISQLLQDKGIDAQTTWLMAIENAAPSQIEELTQDLCQALDKEAFRLASLDADQPALSIRYSLQEVNPYSLANLIEIVLLSIKLKTFTSEELINLGILDLLDSDEFIPLESEALLQFLEELLSFNPPDQLTFQFVEDLCLSHIQYKESIIERLILISSNLRQHIDTAAKVLEIGLSIDPRNVEIFLFIIELYHFSSNSQKSIEVARELYSLTADGRLIDKVIAGEWFVKVLIYNCIYWEEAAKIHQEFEIHLRNLVDERPLDLSIKEAAFYLMNIGFYAPYFNDSPKETHTLRNQIRQLAYDRVCASEKEHIDSYRKRLAIRKKTHTLNRPLKIGYLSSYLRRHSIGHLARWLIQYHDRDRFELYAYFGNYQTNDSLQLWFEKQFHKVHKEKLSSPIDLANQIHQDGIDILIDLDSITAGLASATLAFKPAPIQLTWLGLDASDIPTIDYFIADPYVLPEVAQEYYTAKIWRLPHTYIAVDGFEVGVPTVCRNLLGIPNDAVVYLSAQASMKRHPHVMRMQMQILKLVPNSYLIIKGLGDQNSLQEFFNQQAEAEGVSTDRLRFLPITNGEMEHRANLSIADVVLDTYPYNGATHTLETLWMGIPMVTRVGEQFASRNSYTMMLNAGITEGIAWTDNEYVEWGVRLGNDINLRQQVSWKLKQGQQTAPLWDARQFTKEMENAYEQMWANYLASDSQEQALDPNSDRALFIAEAEMQNTQGIIFAQKGNTDDAIASFQTSISLYSDYVDAYYNLGIALNEKGDLEQAITNFQNTITLNPNHANALYNLGLTLVKLGKPNEAIGYYSQALTITPDDVETHLALGNALFELGKWEEAINSYQAALAFDPNCSSAHCSIGASLSEQGHLDEAITSLQLAIEINPNDAQAYCNLGHVFSKAEQMTDAIHCYETALQIQPNLGNAFWNFNNDILANGDHPLHNNYQLRRQLADQFVEMCGKTDKIKSLVNLITNYAHSGLSDIITHQLLDLEQYIFEHRNHLTNIEVEVLYNHFIFILSSLRDEPSINAHTSKLIGNLYVEQVIKSKLDLDVIVLGSPNHTKIRASQPQKQLRIGFLSPNFGRHPVGWCSLDTIRELNQITPYIYLYATGELKPDDRTSMFEQVAEKFYWYENNTLTDSENTFAGRLARVAADISQDNLDILIDLDSVTTPLNTHILYRQLTPVCISWLGFDAPFISDKNYWLGDWYTHPSTSEQDYVEKIVRLPNSHMAIAGFECVPIDRNQQRKDFGISEDQVAYLFAAPGRKFNRDTAKACIQILKSVPNSVLLHKGKGDLEMIKSTYQIECNNQEVDSNRVKFLPSYKTEEEHRSSYFLADIFLDSYPYNGGSHNLEALWFNLPVVTRVGKQSFARMGYSFLNSVGINEGIASSWEEYVEWGIKLGIDTDLRNSIKDKLIQSKNPNELAPLWNPRKLAKDMYNLLEELVADSLQT